MPLKRRALLISNAGEPGEENYCKGVAVDIANYKRFLQESHGGAWESAEIRHVDRPSEKEVEAEIDVLRLFEYSFVAFAGHGWYSSADQATALTLRKGERISSIKLRKNASRRTIVLDCCREIRKESALSEAMEKKAMVFAAASQKRRPNRILCRQLFDQQIGSASEGLVVLHSSTPPEISGDDERLGGYYTANLIGTANAWAADEADKMWSTASDVFSVVSAHDLAAKQTVLRSGGKQNPTIEKPRTSANFFPLGVFA